MHCTGIIIHHLPPFPHPCRSNAVTYVMTFPGGIANPTEGSLFVMLAIAYLGLSGTDTTKALADIVTCPGFYPSSLCSLHLGRPFSSSWHLEALLYIPFAHVLAYGMFVAGVIGAAYLFFTHIRATSSSSSSHHSRRVSALHPAFSSSADPSLPRPPPPRRRQDALLMLLPSLVHIVLGVLWFATLPKETYEALPRTCLWLLGLQFNIEVMWIILAETTRAPFKYLNALLSHIPLFLAVVLPSLGLVPSLAFPIVSPTSPAANVSSPASPPSATTTNASATVANLSKLATNLTSTPTSTTTTASTWTSLFSLPFSHLLPFSAPTASLFPLPVSPPITLSFSHETSPWFVLCCTAASIIVLFALWWSILTDMCTALDMDSPFAIPPLAKAEIARVKRWSSLPAPSQQEQEQGQQGQQAQRQQEQAQQQQQKQQHPTPPAANAGSSPSSPLHRRRLARSASDDIIISSAPSSSASLANASANGRRSKPSTRAAHATKKI